MMWGVGAVLLLVAVLALTRRVRSREVRGWLLEDMRRGMRAIGWDTDGEMRWVREKTQLRYHRGDMRVSVEHEVGERPWSFQVSRSDVWEDNIRPMGDIWRLMLTLRGDVLEALEAVWAVAPLETQLSFEGLHLRCTVSLMEDWHEAVPKRRRAVELPALVGAVVALGQALERAPLWEGAFETYVPALEEMVEESSLALGWRQRALAHLMLGWVGEVLVERVAIGLEWEETLLRHRLHPQVTSLLEDVMGRVERGVPTGLWVSWDGTSARASGEVEMYFLRGRLAAMGHLSESMARRLARDIWENHTTDAISIALLFPQEDARGEKTLGHWESRPAAYMSLAMSLAWLLDEGVSHLSLDAFQGLMRGMYRMSHPAPYGRSCEAFWEGWPDAYRWSAGLMRHDFVGHLEEIFKEIELDASGLAFLECLLREPVREEILVPLLEHFAARGDGRVLPVLLAARRGWVGALREHGGWERMLAVLRDRVDPAMLGQLMVSPEEGRDGGLSVVRPREGALEVLEDP